MKKICIFTNQKTQIMCFNHWRYYNHEISNDGISISSRSIAKHICNVIDVFVVNVKEEGFGDLK